VNAKRPRTLDDLGQIREGATKTLHPAAIDANVKHRERSSRRESGNRVALASTGSEVILSVEDDGPGVAPEAAEGIFHPFFTTKPDGSGLGLAIAKRIAEDQGGSWSTLEREVGAAFQVHLPILNTEA
jgi:C4-dicarboxylate-specific signal transduction histidine kinase